MAPISQEFYAALLHSNSQAQKVQLLFSLYQHKQRRVLYSRIGRLNIANGWLGLGQMNDCLAPRRLSQEHQGKRGKAEVHNQFRFHKTCQTH